MLMKLRWVLLFLSLSAVYIFWKNSALLLSQFDVLAWKILLFSAAVGLAHLFRVTIFWYVDLSEIIKDDDTRSGLFFLGTMLFYGAAIVAIMSGL